MAKHTALSIYTKHKQNNLITAHIKQNCMETVYQPNGVAIFALYTPTTTKTILYGTE